MSHPSVLLLLCIAPAPAAALQALAAAREEEFERWKGHLEGVEVALQAAQQESLTYRLVPALFDGEQKQRLSRLHAVALWRAMFHDSDASLLQLLPCPVLTARSALHGLLVLLLLLLLLRACIDLLR